MSSDSLPTLTVWAATVPEEVFETEDTLMDIPPYAM
jgi:hypothetical protein